MPRYDHQRIEPKWQAYCDEHDTFKTPDDVTDALYLLTFLFRGGPQPSEPYPQPGVDPSDDDSGSLGCADDEPSP